MNSPKEGTISITKESQKVQAKMAIDAIYSVLPEN